MKANQLLNRLHYLTLVEGEWDEENSFEGTDEAKLSVVHADAGVPAYALRQGKDLLINI